MIDYEEVAYLDLTEVADVVHRRQFRLVEVTEAVFARIDALDPALLGYAHRLNHGIS
ncbi:MULTISPECIES: hypothetical protein [unclassified Rhodococcus (in: high G+C Gram-positive bacteria)]|uniref:hypothetical protein n=1 Tax=unclassified Rhodococcus (in: high G+C Gram-positive bacteria) TaxID=192944 RepID=UPI000ACAE0BE|nr:MULTISPECIES: hypothetical protein [unclassified Rhodococcus (in: high G+C Gram-positive bacteria)]